MITMGAGNGPWRALCEITCLIALFSLPRLDGSRQISEVNSSFSSATESIKGSNNSNDLLPLTENASFIRRERSATGNAHSVAEHDREDNSVGRHCRATHNFSSHSKAAGHDFHLERCTAHAHDFNSPHIHSPAIFFITFTLVMGSLAFIVIHVVHHYVMIPYTVVVLLMGCVYGLIVRTNCSKLSWFTTITDTNAEVFLLIVLPILIYESAFAMQPYLFQKLLVHMLIVGSVGMGIAFVALAYLSVAIFSRSVPCWDIYVGLMFSAIVSAIDPVPVIPLLKESGSVKSLTIILEGTSLLSEATAVVLFKLFSKILSNTEMTVKEEIGYVCRMILGGPAWGLFMGIMETEILTRMNNMWESEILLIISVPYVTFWCADAVFEISGALAVLVLGLWMSSHRAVLQNETADMVHKLWEFLTLVADTLIYSIFGVLITETAVSHLQPEDYWMIILISLSALLVRAVAFCLLQPILYRIGIGNKVFTWPHMFVLVWGGFRGAVTLSLGLLATDAGGVLANYDAEVSSKVVFHSAGIVAFTNIFNASTMRYLLSKIGVLDFPLSRLISLNIALDHLREMQKEQIDVIAADHYMSDTDWVKVQELTTFDKQDFGVHPDFTKFRDVELHFMMRQHEESLAQNTLHPALGPLHHHHHHIELDPTDLHVSSDMELRTELTPEQVKEVESIARLRLIRAKKTSYWKQFRDGTLSQGGVELLDDVTDTLLHSDHGMVGAEDIIHHLRSEKWAGFKRTLLNVHRIVIQKYSRDFIAPSSPRRLFFYHLAISRWLEYFIYFINIVNCSDTIADWVLSGGDVDVSWRAVMFLYMNLSFLLIYIAEAAIKVCGLGWEGYWGSTWISWNRVDFLLLMISFVDIIVAFVCLYVNRQEGKTVVGPAALSVLRVFRFFRLIRLLRAFQLLKPVVPFVLNFLDESVNSHLYYAFDLARAFVIGQEETNVILPTLIGYRPLIAQIKSRSQHDAHFISKELGLLNEQRPDVAAAVKTRQAARNILNHTKSAILDMHRKGVLDDDDVKSFMEDFGSKVKELSHFPHSILVLGGRERLWNVPWIYGNKEVFEIVKVLFVERKYKRGERVEVCGEAAAGIYFVVSGVVSRSFPQNYIDSELGEIYDSDNLEVTFDYVKKDVPLRSTDYILPGTMMNVQSVLLGFPRRSHLTCETALNVLFLDSVTLFKTMKTLPALEAQIWRRVAVCAALNIVIKMGALTDNSASEERHRLSRGAVRLVREGVHVLGLDHFSDVFLIVGVVKEFSTLDREVLHAPRKVSAAYRELEVLQGRDVTFDDEEQEVYPGYAVLLLVPPGEQDISNINIHDSQTALVEPELEKVVSSVDISSKYGAARDWLYNWLPLIRPSAISTTKLAEQPAVPATGMGPRRASNVGQIIGYAKEEERRRSRVQYNSVLTDLNQARLTTNRRSWLN